MPAASHFHSDILYLLPAQSTLPMHSMQASRTRLDCTYLYTEIPP
jgi:hypothetical protein